MYSTIKQDPQRKFDFGVFYMPVLDSTTSTLVPDGIAPTNKAAGYGSLQYSVTKSAADRGMAGYGIRLPDVRDGAGQSEPDDHRGRLRAARGEGGCGPIPTSRAFAESVAYPPAPFQEDDSMLDFEFAQGVPRHHLALSSPAASRSTTRWRGSIPS